MTLGQFKAFVEATRYKTEAETNDEGGTGWVESGDKPTFERRREFNWNKLGIEQTDQHPVVNVSWTDATAFCEWLSKKEGKTYLLPTEAQWEYACRAGSITRWHFGDNEEDLEQYAWYGRELTETAKPVGGRLSNGFGIFDMSGNVWEWCLDWHSWDYYNVSPVDNPRGPSSGTRRVSRGGGTTSSLARSAHRNSTRLLFLHHVYGFRPVLVIDPTDPKPTTKPPTEE